MRTVPRIESSLTLGMTRRIRYGAKRRIHHMAALRSTTSTEIGAHEAADDRAPPDRNGAVLRRVQRMVLLLGGRDTARGRRAFLHRLSGSIVVQTDAVVDVSPIPEADLLNLCVFCKFRQCASWRRTVSIEEEIERSETALTVCCSLRRSRDLRCARGGLGFLHVHSGNRRYVLSREARKIQHQPPTTARRGRAHNPSSRRCR